jgi:2-amino-4-hydroxy-6-hydroxymethyldihydropteridine diphosphokinase
LTSPRWTHLVSLGSNVEPDRWVPEALDLLRLRFDVRAVSARYAAAAEGGGALAPPFVNMALRLATDLPARALAAACRHLEARCGRRRTADRFAPRTMDLDVVYSVAPDGQVRGEHDDLTRAAYVAVPCADAWPEAAVTPPEAAPTTLAALVAERFPDWRAAHRVCDND